MDKLNDIDLALINELSDQFGLPLHIVFTNRFNDNTNNFKDIIEEVYPNTLICFAVKCNPCRGAVRTASRLGIGVDTVSEYELQVSLEEGIPAQNIVCNGNAKSGDYLDMIVESGALCAVDNSEELEQIDKIAKGRKLQARILLRFAGMPLEGLTSADQSTASRWTKFGFSVEHSRNIFCSMKNYPHVHYEGLSAHIGTQICDPTGYLKLWDRFFELIETAADAGLENKILDIGGGFPVSYMTETEWKVFKSRLRKQIREQQKTNEWVTWDNLPMGYGYLAGREVTESDPWFGKAYWTEFSGAKMFEYFMTAQASQGQSVRARLAESGSPLLIIEPGRALIGTAGITVARVVNIKKVVGNYVVTLDMGIVNHGTNLVTPDIFPVEVVPRKGSDIKSEAFLAGRLCFTGDTISKVKITLNRLPGAGELVIIHHTGAYSADHFASNSCGFPRPAKIAVNKEREVDIWRKAERFEDVFGK